MMPRRCTARAYLNTRVDGVLQSWQPARNAGCELLQLGCGRGAGAVQLPRCRQRGGHSAEHQRVQHLAGLGGVHRTPQVKSAGKVEVSARRLSRLLQKALALAAGGAQREAASQRHLCGDGRLCKARHLAAQRRPLQQLQRFALGAPGALRCLLVWRRAARLGTS